jgi:hypothetical protein
MGLFGRSEKKKDLQEENPLQVKGGESNPYLLYIQGLGFYPDWNAESLMKKLDYELGMDENEFKDDPFRALTDIMVNTIGFGIDCGFTSADLIFNVNNKLKGSGIEITKDNPDANDDEVIDQATWRRKTKLIYGSQGLEVEYETPSDLIRPINEMISQNGFLFLQKELDGDTYQYIVVRKDIGDRIISDGKLKFQRP